MTYDPTVLTSVYLRPDFVLPNTPDRINDAIVRREVTTAYIVNQKQNGQYDTIEQLAGQYFFVVNNNQSKRQAFRKVINWGALPNAAAQSQAHGITGITVWTNIYGAARGNRVGVPFPGFPLPYVNLAGNSIQVDVDDTNVTITTSINYSDYDAIVVLEYLKE